MYLNTVLPCCQLGEAAPAAAHLQHTLTGLQLQHVRNASILCQLSLIQRFLTLCIHIFVKRCRVGHAAIQPESVELVAQIVMVGNIAATALAGVRAAEVTYPIDQSQQQVALDQMLHRLLIAKGPAEQRFQIWTVPIPFHITLGPADGTTTQQPAQRTIVIQAYFGARLTFTCSSKLKHLSRGQLQIEGTEVNLRQVTKQCLKAPAIQPAGTGQSIHGTQA